MIYPPYKSNSSPIAKHNLMIFFSELQWLLRGHSEPTDLVDLPAVQRAPQGPWRRPRRFRRRRRGVDLQGFGGREGEGERSAVLGMQFSEIFTIRF